MSSDSAEDQLTLYRLDASPYARQQAIIDLLRRHFGFAMQLSDLHEKLSMARAARLDTALIESHAALLEELFCRNFRKLFGHDLFSKFLDLRGAIAAQKPIEPNPEFQKFWAETTAQALRSLALPPSVLGDAPPASDSPE